MIAKIYHMAAKINGNGDVSALCYKRPRRIDLRIASWTVRPEAVTCGKCRRALAARTTPADRGEG